MNVRMKMPKPTGRFELIAISSTSGNSRCVAAFDNLITNIGLDFLSFGCGNPNNNFLSMNGIAVGTGTTPEAPSNTHMEDYLAGTATIIGSSVAALPAPNYGVASTYSFQFPVGAAAGNLTEIGAITPQSTGSVTVPSSSWFTFSRALIKDSMGNPTTITILSDEILVVNYTITFFPFVADATGTFPVTVDGVTTNYTYTSRSAVVNNTAANTGWFWNLNCITANGVGNDQFTNGSLGAITGRPSIGASPGVVTPNTRTYAPYVDGTFFISATYTLNTTTGNLSGGLINCIFCVFAPFIFQMQFTPGLPKTSLQTLSLTVNLSWSN